MKTIILSHRDIDLIIEVLNMEIKRRDGLARMTKNSGYGKSSTFAKAEKHKDYAEVLNEIINKICYD